MTQSDPQTKTGKGSGSSYLMPLILVTSLFFLWGLAYGLLDVLNKHFQDTLAIDKGRSTMLQMAYFGAYFLIALPAGIFMNRFGYKNGIITGLLLYGLGAFLFYPSAQIASFQLFLLALFILASGLTFLETAANPYVTVLGKPETSVFRLNLSQSFNGVGSFLGPIIAANLFFNKSAADNNLDSVKLVYVVIGIIVLGVAALFWKTHLPEIKEAEATSAVHETTKPLSKNLNFKLSVITQFFYVAAQVGVAALFINYCLEANTSITSADASYLLSVSLLLFTVGRMTGTALLKKFSPNFLLALYAVINTVLCIVVVLNYSWISIYSLMAVFFFESIMFPTIFALGIKNTGPYAKRASSVIIMSIVGGALVPNVMGWMADHYSTAWAYTVPAFCFSVVAWYGWRGYKKTI